MGDWAEHMKREIQRCDPDLSAAMDREEAEPGWRMPDELLARLDAWLHGSGYLVHGRRVAPEFVIVVSAPEHESF